MHRDPVPDHLEIRVTERHGLAVQEEVAPWPRPRTANGELTSIVCGFAQPWTVFIRWLDGKPQRPGLAPRRNAASLGSGRP